MALTKIKIPSEHEVLMEELVSHYLQPLKVETKRYENGITIELSISLNGLPSITQISYFDLLFVILPPLVLDEKDKSKLFNSLQIYFGNLAREISNSEQYTQSIAYLYDFYARKRDGYSSNTISID